MEKNINRFDDVFHQHGDDLNENDDQHAYFYLDDPINGRDNENDDVAHFFGDDNTTTKNEELDNPYGEIKVSDEEILSQKLSQLSAKSIVYDDGDNDIEHIDLPKFETNDDELIRATTILESSSKRMKTMPREDLDDIANEERISIMKMIPTYLSSSHLKFDQMVQGLLQKANLTVNVEHLREIATLMHQLQCFDLQITLWQVYLRSGTGTLFMEEEERQQQQCDREHQKEGTRTNSSSNYQRLKIWPEDVKREMVAQHQGDIQNGNDSQSCLDYVRRVLQQFNYEKRCYQRRIHQWREHLQNNLTCGIEQALNEFVQQNITLTHRIPIEQKIATVEYEYKDQQLQFEFSQQNPSPYQRDLFKMLYRLKFDREQAKFDVAVLKQRILHNQIPTAFNSLKIPELLPLDMIEDKNMQQRLKDRSEKIIERSKTDMMLVYIATTETQFHQYDVRLRKEMNMMKAAQHSGPSYKQFTQTMSDLMNQRFNLLAQYRLRLYRLKLRFFAKAPTVTR